MKDKEITKEDLHLLQLADENLLYKYKLDDKDYFLTSKKTFESDTEIIIFPSDSGKAAIWNGSVFNQNREKEASMRPYFKEFTEKEWGVSALVPYSFKDNGDENQYSKQFNYIFEKITKKDVRIGIIAYGIGAAKIFDILLSAPETRKKIKSLILIDPLVDQDWAKGSYSKELFLQFLKEKAVMYASNMGKEKEGLNAVKLAQNLNIKCIEKNYPHETLPNSIVTDIKRHLILNL